MPVNTYTSCPLWIICKNGSKLSLVSVLIKETCSATVFLWAWHKTTNSIEELYLRLYRVRTWSGLCQHCHVVLWKTGTAWTVWVVVTRRHGVGWVHGGVCEQALPWQMGSNGILQGVVPPYGKPRAPDEEQNSRSSCLWMCHLRLQAKEMEPPQKNK